MCAAWSASQPLVLYIACFHCLPLFFPFSLKPLFIGVYSPSASLLYNTPRVYRAQRPLHKEGHSFVLQGVLSMCLISGSYPLSVSSSGAGPDGQRASWFSHTHLVSSSHNVAWVCMGGEQA